MERLPLRRNAEFLFWLVMWCLLILGLASWIIQDGNYPDFSTGDQRRFALEFSTEILSPSGSKEPYVEHVSGARYAFAAKVVFVNDEVWVIDFGLPAYTEAQAPEFVRQGMCVEGKLYLGVDPFFYMESLRDSPGMPSLFLDFRIERILLETTPWIAGYVGATRTLVRDETKESFLSVPKTDAWRDDNQNAHYVLGCTLLSPGPHTGAADH